MYKKIKKMIVLTMVLLLSFGITGCSKSEADQWLDGPIECYEGVIKNISSDTLWVDIIQFPQNMDADHPKVGVCEFVGNYLSRKYNVGDTIAYKISKFRKPVETEGVVPAIYFPPVYKCIVKPCN